MESKKSIKEIIESEDYSKNNLTRLLSAKSSSDIEYIHKKAEEILLKYCSNKVYYRGLIEFSNICSEDCFYCGIRKSNSSVNRYSLSLDDIIDCSIWCVENGYGSIVLQSGERSDKEFIEFVEEAVKTIKEKTKSSILQKGLGITLCVGNQTKETYQRFFNAGAHRYLLRIETTNPELFKSIHPNNQKLDDRVECLNYLKEIGFQVGTGVMIGIPNQTVEMLADDILFFKKMDLDMFGMGPFIPHSNTPLAKNNINISNEDNMRLSLLMLSVTRLVMKDVNIAATTALQALDSTGREKGLRAGANIIMPQLTPTKNRNDYLLYENKPCVDESKEECRGCLSRRVESVDRVVGLNEWGDSNHF